MNEFNKIGLTYHLLLLFIRIEVLWHKLGGILVIVEVLLMHDMVLMAVAMMIVNVRLVIRLHVAFLVHFEAERFQLIVFY